MAVSTAETCRHALTEIQLLFQQFLFCIDVDTYTFMLKHNGMVSIKHINKYTHQQEDFFKLPT